MKKQPPKKSGKEKMISFRALPEEVEHWTEMAEAEDRSLSNWIRLKVNESLEDNKQPSPKNDSEAPPESRATRNKSPQKRES